MECAEPRHALDHAADDLADAVFHFARRLVGERDGQNLARPGAAGRQDVGDAHGQHPRFAGAGTGEHEHRAVERFDRKPLLGIQSREIVSGAGRGGAGARGNAAGRGHRRCRIERVEALLERISQGAKCP
jgi:hypothetical protein